MKATFTPDDSSGDVVLCDYGVEENSGLDSSFEDLVEQLEIGAADVIQLHRGKRIVSERFSSMREYASQAAMEAAVFTLKRDKFRTTGTVTFACSTDGGSTTLASFSLTEATVRLAAIVARGLSVLLTWDVRGALVEPSS